MIMRVIYQFINSQEARWATNATKHEVKVDWMSRAPLGYYARSRPEAKGEGRNGKRDRGVVRMGDGEV